ncbi:MAG: hypothetical protein H7Z13_03065 [Ferruginibacter sp.]|nr:hypothetical protein [Ferruginibacter sp.]
MKKILYLIIAIVILTGCKTSRDYLLRSDEDKTLYDIVKKLNKRTNDEEATKALPEVYTQVRQRHLKNINSYNSYNDISKWDKLISEYNSLQNIYNAIDNSVYAGRLVTAVSYQDEISAVKMAAAEDYYRLGESYLDNNSREYAKKAYNAFKKAGTWVRDYKNSKQKMDEAYNSSIVNVMINPVQDNSFFFNTGWGNAGYNYSNAYFQQNLVLDLGGKYASRYPARFYTEWEARRDNVQPDWVIDLTLRNIDVPRPLVYNYSRNVSKKIEIGSDTSGKPVYKNVYATLNIQRQSFNARAQLDVNIVEIATRRNIAYNSYNDTYSWQDEVATYTGDRRALSNNDWALINNNNFNLPGRDDILNRLYRNIYPQVKTRISNEVDW